MPAPHISTFDQLRSFITTNFPDNNSGLVDPEDVRVALRSFVDIQSLRNDLMTANLLPEQAAVWQELINKLDQIQRESKSGITGTVTQANAPTPYDAVTYPNGLFETYVVRTPLTMPNSWGSAVTQAELDVNFVYFDVKNGVVSKDVSLKPMHTLATVLNPTNITIATTGKSVADHVKIRDVSTQLIGKNKFNLATVTRETLVNESGVITPYSGWSTSEKIYIKPDTYYSYTGSIVSVFDVNNTLLLRQDWNLTNFKTPSNASYVILSVGNDSLSTLQLEEGTFNTSYESYNIVARVDTSKIENNSIPLSKLENGFLRGNRVSKNLANYRVFKDGFYISETTGEELSNGGFCVSPFIPIKSDTFYVQTNGNRVAFYTSENEDSFISGLAAMDYSFKTPPTANFIKVCTGIPTKQNYQLEEGTTQTAYQDYLTYKLDKSLVTKFSFPFLLLSFLSSESSVSNGFTSLDSSSSNSSVFSIMISPFLLNINVTEPVVPKFPPCLSNK